MGVYLIELLELFDEFLEIATRVAMLLFASVEDYLC